jgi:hypothetical protein
MAVKLELSKTQVSSIFTPMDVILFETGSIACRFVFFFGACEISIASSSFKRFARQVNANNERITLKTFCNFDRPQ